MSIKMMRFGELFDKGATTPSGGARGAGGGGRRGDGEHRAQRRRQARVRAAAALPAAYQLLSALLGTLPQIGIRAIHVEFSVRQQPPRVRASIQICVRRRGAFVTFYFCRFTTAGIFGRVTSLDGRKFSVVIVRYVSSGCVILYFTERQVAAVHCRCDIKAAACNKIERFRLPDQETNEIRSVLIRLGR